MPEVENPWLHKTTVLRTGNSRPKDARFFQPGTFSARKPATVIIAERTHPGTLQRSMTVPCRNTSYPRYSRRDTMLNLTGARNRDRAAVPMIVAVRISLVCAIVLVCAPLRAQDAKTSVSDLADPAPTHGHSLKGDVFNE